MADRLEPVDVLAAGLETYGGICPAAALALSIAWVCLIATESVSGRFAPHLGHCRGNDRGPEADMSEAGHVGTFAPEADSWPPPSARSRNDHWPDLRHQGIGGF